MFQINEIKDIHLELSSRCNARCPLCPRNLNGFPKNLGYTETDLPYSLIQARINPTIISNLQSILINGNFGDFVMNNESIDIIEYFRRHNDGMTVLISTNGSARDRYFWQHLAKLNVKILFCLDGLEDTHHLYRQDTSWQKIIQNASYFIEAGGQAVWKMIKFDHNQHQIDDCKQLALAKGFVDFHLIDQGRNTGLVFDRQGNWSHNIGDPKIIAKNANAWLKFNELKQDRISFLTSYDTSTAPSCMSKKKSSIYISADAKVYPCCWIGHNPLNYDYGHLGQLNNQLRDLIKENSLHEFELAHCINWFNKVEETFNKTTYEDGRLMRCDTSCGKKINTIR